MTSPLFTLDELPFVRTQLNYIAPMEGTPTTYADPPPGIARKNWAFQVREARIHDARPVREKLSLDREGFALTEHVSEVSHFWSHEPIEKTYYPEAL